MGKRVDWMQRQNKRLDVFRAFLFLKLFYMKYGELPSPLGQIKIDCQEMMFYQYLPIKLENKPFCDYENRLNVFDDLIQKSIDDFILIFGYEKFVGSNIYLTAKHQYQTPEKTFNRMGYHADGFLTDDINYIWSDKSPTVFNKSNFNLTLDDVISMKEMEEQALKENEVTYPINTLLRLNQFNIHKVSENQEEGMRTFVKISFSKDKYDLIGNSHNYELDYNWEMKPRKQVRNIPQSIEINP